MIVDYYEFDEVVFGVYCFFDLMLQVWDILVLCQEEFCFVECDLGLFYCLYLVFFLYLGCCLGDGIDWVVCIEGDCVMV